MTHDPNSQDHDAPPFNPLPPAVWLLAIVIIGIELWLTAGARGLVGGREAIGWRIDALNAFAFSGVYLERWLLVGVENWGDVARLVTHAFVHQSLTEAGFVAVFILALGKMTSDAFGQFSFLTIFFGSAIIGALGYGAILGRDAILIGGYAGVFGLVGAFTFVRWIMLGVAGGKQYQAFYLIGMFMGLRLLFGALYGTHSDWIAELLAFFVGFGLSVFLAPGAFTAILRRIRRD